MKFQPRSPSFFDARTATPQADGALMRQWDLMRYLGRLCIGFRCGCVGSWEPWGGGVCTDDWVLLVLPFLALSLVSGHDYRITQGSNVRKNCLADKGPKLDPKPATLTKGCASHGRTPGKYMYRVSLVSECHSTPDDPRTLFPPHV